MKFLFKILTYSPKLLYMKKLLIGSLVGALLVFSWQAVAHMFMHHHDAAFKKAPNEAAIINALSSNLQQEGQYMVPGMDRNASAEAQQQHSESMKGKPWAMVTYHPVFEENMGMSSLRSFSTAFLCVLIFITLMGKSHGRFASVVLKGFGIGFFAFLFVWYNQNIWVQTPWDVIKGEMIDTLVAWTLCGLWLGWWLNRGPNAIAKRYSTAS